MLEAMRQGRATLDHDDVARFSPENFASIADTLGSIQAADLTGQLALDLVRQRRAVQFFATAHRQYLDLRDRYRSSKDHHEVIETAFRHLRGEMGAQFSAAVRTHTSIEAQFEALVQAVEAG